MNRFIGLSFSKKEQHKGIFTCTNNNQTNGSSTTCDLQYGPKSSNCDNLQYKATVGMAKSLSASVDVNFSFLEKPSETEFCFALNASDGTKNTIVVGIYDTAGT